MTAQAEHALRTLAVAMQVHADKFGQDTVEGRIMAAMANAHMSTSITLETERKSRDAALYENESGFRYDPRGKAAANR
jgi:hypothetical protein